MFFRNKDKKPVVNGKHTNKVLGDYGENIAVKYLKKHGYKILERNFSSKLGEIDIIAQDDDYLVFIEVKFRTTKLYGLPNEAVDKYKQEKIRRTALFYLHIKNLHDSYVRFDVVDILGDDVQLIKNAF